MQTQLTRHIFQQILYGRSIGHVHCSSQCSRISPFRRSGNGVSTRIHSRSFLGFSRKPPRQPKPRVLAPGYETIAKTSIALKLKTRTPPRTEIAQALRTFYHARSTQSQPLEEMQVRQSLTAFRHLVEVKYQLSIDDMLVALKALVFSARQGHEGPLKELAQVLFNQLLNYKDKLQEKFFYDALSPYIQVLTLNGDSAAARHYIRTCQQDGQEQPNSRNLWRYILRGFATEGNDHEVQQTLDMMKDCDIPFDAEAQESLVAYFSSIQDLASSKKWYLHPVFGHESHSIGARIAVLQLCARVGDLEWGEEVFRKLFEKDPSKEAWDVIFQWAAAKSKGVDEVERMMHIMVQRNEEHGDSMRPDVETINGLVELANIRNDPYTAERYISLATSWDIPLDAQTYLLQLDYRIKVGDLDGARTAYDRLKAYEVLDKRDIPLINRLIVSMCKVERSDHESIMSLVDDLTERKAEFKPETVAVLCLMHLRRDELLDATDLLMTHSFHYGVDQRAMIRDVFVSFIMDRSNSEAVVWEVYCILAQVFTETNTKIRTQLMNEFFERNRSDMALYVFGYMRQQSQGGDRPNVDTYRQCFEGIAKAADSEALGTVYNMMKLDPDIEPDTRLYNALMLAHMACDQPQRSIEFWEDIVYSREGPTYNSIRIALRACEKAPFGDRQVREIWKLLEKFEIEITREIYDAYVGALAGSGLVIDALVMVNEMEVRTGYTPDVSTYVFFCECWALN